MIKEDYVGFEIAKLLKEKEFDIYVRSYYEKNKYKTKEEFSTNNALWNYNISSFRYSAPTLQMAMKWLREVKHIPIEILWHYDVDSDVEEWYFIHHAELRILPNDIEYYETYEKACEAGIKYCLENLI